MWVLGGYTQGDSDFVSSGGVLVECMERVRSGERRTICEVERIGVFGGDGKERQDEMRKASSQTFGAWEASKGREGSA